MTPPVQPDLRQLLETALRAAAYDCDGDCGLDADQCFEQHPIQVSVVHFDQVAGVYGYISALAAVAAEVVQPLLDQLAAENADLHRRLDDIESLCDHAESTALATWQDPQPVPQWAIDARAICRRAPAAAPSATT